jgi:hypothetical protein
VSKQSYPRKRKAGAPPSVALRRRVRRLERQLDKLRVENELLAATALLYARSWGLPLVC